MISNLFATVLEEPLPLAIPTAVLLGLLIAAHFLRAPRDTFPIINNYPREKAHAVFLENARSLLRDGLTKFNGQPFRVTTTLGSRVILPPSFTEWVKGCKELDHQEFVAREYFSGYPGFGEANALVTDPRRILIDVTRTKLAQGSQCQVFHHMLDEVLDEVWGDDKEWHAINWSTDSIRFVGRMSAGVFVGPALSRDPEWQELTMTYTANAFAAVRALRAWPAILRPVVHWFLPEAIKSRRQVSIARAKFTNILRERKQSGQRFEDAITWMEEAAAGRPFDPVTAQLAFALAALHTTSELLKQTLLDIASHPELVKPLREEIEAAVEKNGWTTAGLFQMPLLDSVTKESQRVRPGALVNLERHALRDVVMPNGATLPRGTHISVDTSAMWDPKIYPNPEKFDGYRFLRLREAGSKTVGLVSTSAEHFAFGLGRPICPGRFFAANEVKIAVAGILINYDVQLQKGYEPKVVEYGFEMLADPAAKLEVRRR